MSVNSNVRYRRVATSEDHARTAQENKKLRADFDKTLSKEKLAELIED